MSPLEPRPREGCAEPVVIRPADRRRVASTNTIFSVASSEFPTVYHDAMRRRSSPVRACQICLPEATTSRRDETTGSIRTVARGAHGVSWDGWLLFVGLGAVLGCDRGWPGRIRTPCLGVIEVLHAVAYDETPVRAALGRDVSEVASCELGCDTIRGGIRLWRHHKQGP